MVDFPITGPYRSIILPLEIIMIGIILQISTYFFLKFLKSKKESIPSVVEFDWGILFLSFGTAYLMFIVSDFFYVKRELFLTFGYVCFGIGGSIYAYHIESTKIINTRFFFFGFTNFMIFLYLLTIFLAPSMVQIVASITALAAIFLLLTYFIKVMKKIWVKYKLNSIGLLLGFFLWFLGFIATADISVKLFNSLNIRILGDMIILIGLCILGLSLNSIPSLSEIGWKEQIKYIILLSNSGICLYNENFKEKKRMEESEIDENALAGALAALKLFLEENLKKEYSKLKMISKEKDVFLMEEGDFIIGVLIVEQELEILRFFLKKIVRQFEEFFYEALRNWNGNVDLFKPTKSIINKIFSIEKIY